MDELLDAVKGVMPYLTHSLDDYVSKPWNKETFTDGDRLRMQAEEADRKDVAIARLREVVARRENAIPTV